MGLAQTFERLRTERPERYRAYVERALREPDARVQRAAAEALMAAREARWLKPLVLAYADLQPEVRARLHEERLRLRQAAEMLLRSASVEERESAARVLSRVASMSDARLLVGLLSDGSPRVVDTVLPTIARLASDQQNVHLRARGGDQGAEADAARDRADAALLVEAMFRRYEEQGDSAYVSLALEMGRDLHVLLLSCALANTAGRLYRDLVGTLTLGRSPEAYRFVVSLAADRTSAARALFLEVLRRRDDAAFVRELGAFLRSIPPEQFGPLAAKFLEVPWWPRVEEATSLDAETAQVHLAFLLSSRTEEATTRQRIRALLRHRSAEARAAALAALEATRPRDLEEVARGLLADPSDDVKAAAASILARARAPGLAALLAPFVRSPHSQLNAIALRVIAEASYDRYMRTFDKLDEKTRQTAARAIAKIDATLVDRLRVEVEGLDPERRLKALRIAEYADAAEQLRPVLREILQDPDVKVRATAIKMLGVAGSPEGLKVLIDALNDKDRRIRANAVEAFEEIGDTRFTFLLKPFLGDPDNRVRANAAKGLWRLGVADGRATLEEMLRSDDRLMRLSAAWAMGEIAAPEFEPALRARLADEADDRVRERILQALAAIGAGGGTDVGTA